MYTPKENPSLYFNLLHQKRVAELLLTAIRFDLFSHLEQKKSPKEIAKMTGLHERSLQLVLGALAATGFLEKTGELYRNTTQTNEYLNKSSQVYLGETILFREKMMSLSNIESCLKTGPNQAIQSSNKGVEVYDFYEGARVSIPEMYAGRVQSMLESAKGLFEQFPPRKILDLGGGNGVLAIELVKKYKDCKGVIFEHPNVAPLPRQLIVENELDNCMEVMEGDFNKDAIGEGYDFIIASGILDFAKDHLDYIMQKLSKALKPEGILYLVTNEISKDFLTPPQAILGWLSSHLEGLDLLLNAETIETYLEKYGFEEINMQEVNGAYKGLRGRFYKRGKN